MKTLAYTILSLVMLLVLTCHYTPLTDPVAAGDGAHYQAMAHGFLVPQPFVDRSTIPTIIRFLAGSIDISSWTFDRIDNVDAWFYVWTLMCLWGTMLLVRAVMLRLLPTGRPEIVGRTLADPWFAKWRKNNTHREQTACLAGFLYGATFWLSGYQLSNFWLQDPFVNLLIWLAIWLWTHKWWYGLIGLALPIAVKGGALGYNWAVFASACSFYKDIPQLIYAFGFLWLPIVLVDRKLLAILAVLFITGRIVTADVARAGVAVFSFPVLWGVCMVVDKYKLSPVIMMLIFMLHLWQQSRWIFQ